MRLTKRSVETLTYTGEGNGACYVWDDDLPGFGVRVFPSGSRSFVLAYRVNDRKRFLTLGAFGKITVDEARRIAKAKVGEVVTGGDPQADKERALQGETIAELVAAYQSRHVPTKKTGVEDMRRLERFILPRWGAWKVEAVRRADVAALHTTIGKTAPYEANRVLALLSKLFSLAEKWGFREEGKLNPAHGIDKYREKKRDRWVTPLELPRLAEAINEELNESARTAIWLYLLTGTRKSELLKARWEHVDWERRELCLPDPKSGRKHYVPLSTPALALLEIIPHQDGNPYIFPGKLPGEALVNIAKPWNRIRKAAGVEDVRIHDLRRTVGSWLAQSGNSLHLIGLVLNHSNTSTTAIYARFGQDHAREALEQHATRLLEVVGDAAPGKMPSGNGLLPTPPEPPRRALRSKKAKKPS
jgi:integrase